MALDVFVCKNSHQRRDYWAHRFSLGIVLRMCYCLTSDSYGTHCTNLVIESYNRLCILRGILHWLQKKKKRWKEFILAIYFTIAKASYWRREEQTKLDLYFKHNAKNNCHSRAASAKIELHIQKPRRLSFFNWKNQCGFFDCNYNLTRARAPNDHTHTFTNNEINKILLRNWKIRSLAHIECENRSLICCFKRFFCSPLFSHVSALFNAPVN